MTAMASACAGIVALSARVGRRSASDGSRWRQAHLPMLAAIICGLGAVGHDPLSVALLAGKAAPTPIAGAFVWLVIGLPIAAISVAVGIGMVRGARVSMPGVWCAAAAGSLVCGLALAGRIALLDGQLMMLGGLALAWWRASVTPQEPERELRATWEAPPAYALALAAGLSAMWTGESPWALSGVAVISMATVVAALALAVGRDAQRVSVGEEAWSALGASLMGLGIVTVGRIGVMGYAEVRRAALTTGEPPAFVLADVVWSGPYVGGIATQAPEGLWLLGLAGVMAIGGMEGARRRLWGVVCVVVGAGILAWRLARWGALGW